jgi:hypothetical protein
LEEHIASIFRGEKYAKQGTSMKAGGKQAGKETVLTICFHAGIIFL